MKNGDKDISEKDSKLQAGPRRNWGARVIVLLFPLVKVSIKATDTLYREIMDHCTKIFFFLSNASLTWAYRFIARSG